MNDEDRTALAEIINDYMGPVKYLAKVLVMVLEELQSDEMERREADADRVSGNREERGVVQDGAAAVDERQLELPDPRAAYGQALAKAHFEAKAKAQQRLRSKRRNRRGKVRR